MLRRISTIAKLTPYSSIISPYILTKVQKTPSPFSSKFYSSNGQKKPLDDIGLICCGLKLEEFKQKKEERQNEEEKNEKEKNEEKEVEGEEDELEKKFDEFMSGEFRKRNEILYQFLRSLEQIEIEEVGDLARGRTKVMISTDEKEISEHKFNPGDFPMDRLKDFFTDFVLLVSSAELAAKLTVVLRDVATKGPWTAWSNVWDKFSLDVKDYACMSQSDFESLIKVSSKLKNYVDVLEKEENPKGGGKAGEKKEEEKKGEEEKKDGEKGEEEKKDGKKGEGGKTGGGREKWGRGRMWL